MATTKDLTGARLTIEHCQCHYMDGTSHRLAARTVINNSSTGNIDLVYIGGALPAVAATGVGYDSGFAAGTWHRVQDCDL